MSAVDKIFLNNSFQEPLLSDGNNITNATNPFMNEEFTIAATLIFAIIFVLGVFGNVIFIYIVISSSHTAIKTVTNYFLVNLAVADILFCLLCIPLQITVITLEMFPFGGPACHMFAFLQPVAVCSSSFTLIAISAERYMNIRHPLRPRLKTRDSKLVIASIWTLSCLFAITEPFQIKYEIPEDPTVEGWQCYRESSTKMMKIYDYAMLLIQYVIPVLLMAFCYSMMAYTIWIKRGFGQAQSSQFQEARKNQMLRSKKKMIKMLMVIVFIYTMCYFPINIIWTILGEFAVDHPWFHYLHTIFLGLAYSHTCYNPIIYFWMNRKVRYRFLAIASSIPVIKVCFKKCEWTTPLQRHSTMSRANGDANGSSYYQNQMRKKRAASRFTSMETEDTRLWTPVKVPVSSERISSGDPDMEMEPSEIITGNHYHNDPSEVISGNHYHNSEVISVNHNDNNDQRGNHYHSDHNDSLNDVDPSIGGEDRESKKVGDVYL